MKITASLIRTRNFTWNANLVFGFNKNKITQNGLVDSNPVNNRAMSIPVQTRWKDTQAEDRFELSYESESNQI